MEIRFEDVPARRIATLPHRGAYHRIGATFERAVPITAQAGLQAQPMVGVYYDHPEHTPEPDLRSAAGILLPDGAECPKGTDESTLPPGRYLVGVHEGAYDRMQESWGRLMEDLDRRNLEHGHGPAYEVYENSMLNSPESELRTELYLITAS